MKKIVLIALMLLVVALPAFATETEKYMSYNQKMGQLIFKQITLMEKANELFNMWMKKDISKDDAVQDLGNISKVMSDIRKDIDQLNAVSPSQDLHSVYSKSSDMLTGSVKNNIDFIIKNKLGDDSIREKIQAHLLGYVDQVYDCQIKNIEAQLLYQQKMKLDGEKANVKDYFDWNNKVMNIMLQQVGISKDMEKMLIKYSTGGSDSEETQKEEKALQNRTAALKKSIDSITPGIAVKELHSLYQKSYENYLTFHNSLYDYLKSPSKDKSAVIQENARSANTLNFQFNEACFKFLEKNTGKSEK
jgi:hypothetical protein